MKTEKQKHTPEPWSIRPFKSYDKLIYIPEPSVAVDNDDVDQRESKANAERIVTCVNALAGIPDPAKALEKVREALEGAFQEFAMDYCSLDKGIGVATDWGKRRIAVREALALITPKEDAQ